MKKIVPQSHGTSAVKDNGSTPEKQNKLQQAAPTSQRRLQAAKVVQIEPSQSPSPPTKKQSIGNNTSNIKVKTEVFLSKVRMLSPDSRQSRSFPNINAFPGGSECKSNKTGQSKKGSKRSMKSRRKGSQDRFSQADMNITDTAAIEVEPSDSAVSPLLKRDRTSYSRKRD